jgi:hypothetical protein
MNTQVVYDHANVLGLREMHITQFFHAMGKINLSASLGHDNMPPTDERLQIGEQFARAIPLIFIIIAQGLSGFDRKRLTRLAD